MTYIFLNSNINKKCPILEILCYCLIYARQVLCTSINIRYTNVYLAKIPLMEEMQ